MSDEKPATINPEVLEPQGNAQKPPSESLAEILGAVDKLLPNATKWAISIGWQSTVQLALIVAGGMGVLSLAFFAAWRGNWDLAEKIGIPVLAFFGGLLAGRKG